MEGVLPVKIRRRFRRAQTQSIPCAFLGDMATGAGGATVPGKLGGKEQGFTQLELLKGSL
jgi:hypothetical protein